MDIDISPTDVIRSADGVAAAAEQLPTDAPPGHGGNDGFRFSAALGEFTAQMQESTRTASQATTGIADKLEASATFLRRVDDDAAEAAHRLWAGKA